MIRTAAVLAYEVAIDKYNALVTEAFLYSQLGNRDAGTEAETTSAGDRVQALLVGCGKSEPGDACVARKARDAAR